MPVSQITAIPLSIRKPFIRLGDSSTGVEVECAATHVTLEPNQDSNTTETFCGTYTTYKPPVWTLTISVAMSYGATGFWNLMTPLMGTTTTFEVRPDTAVMSAANPSYTGSIIVGYTSPIDADPGGVSEVDLECAVQGKISVDTGTGPVPMALEGDTEGDTEMAVA